jgi:hypothetical protein
MNVRSICQRITNLAILFLVNSAVHAASPDAPALLAEINATGARQVIARLNARPNPNEWDAVVRQIRSGRSQWVDVAGGLAREADAGAAADLKISLAYALTKNPEGVLKLAGSQDFLKIEGLCGAPFIEPTDKFLRRYLTQAKRAVGEVQVPQLKSRKAACMAQLENAETQLRAARMAGK